MASTARPPTAYPIDILTRRLRRFTLWTPGRSSELIPGSGNEPHLVIGVRSASSPPSFLPVSPSPIPLVPHPSLQDLWELDPAAITDPAPLQDGVAYWYWFTVLDSTPEVPLENRTVVHVTDPLAYAVDYALVKPPYNQPAAVIKYRIGLLAADGTPSVTLVTCDVDGSEPGRPKQAEGAAAFPRNSQMVIYELPTTWTRQGRDAVRDLDDVDVGNFEDVAALFSSQRSGKNFSSMRLIREGAHLVDLGINSLELLPIADALVRKEWGYATANYFAPDADLGGQGDLVTLIDTLWANGVRWIADTVMAFGYDSYAQLAFEEMHMRPAEEQGNSEAWQSHADPPQLRDGYGGRSWRYVRPTQTYDPETGREGLVQGPSWGFHTAHQARWFADFGVGGFRLDSVNNIANWNFVKHYRNAAWRLYNSTGGDPAKFLVIGEELSSPISMLTTGCLDALWNERWQTRVRAVIMGWEAEHDNFEWTVRKLINPLLDGPFDGNLRYTDGAQCVNYVTSHDVQGDNRSKARLYDYLQARGVWDVEPRAKLAHVLLLTSVGIPMILAGEEFADKSDRNPDDWRVKQTDPVNWERKADAWRTRVFEYVARLVRLRTRCPALAVNDTAVIHVDGSRDGKIMAWRRGADDDTTVVVVANFTDSPTTGSEYVVPNWPGWKRHGWREVTQNREVPEAWVGREPLSAWEAKVYTMWRE